MVYTPIGPLTRDPLCDILTAGKFLPPIVCSAKEGALTVNQLCRYLAIPGDEQVRYSYPSNLNVCYADRDSLSEFVPVEPEHQREYCLTSSHVVCPIYLRRTLGTQDDAKHRPQQTFFEFFDLSEEPFSIVPQPRFLAESGVQKQAHAGLRWLVERKHGLAVLYGPVGTGKTLLCRTMAEELAASPHFAVGTMLTPSYRTEYAFMSDLLTAWGISPERRRSLQDLDTAALEFLKHSVFDHELTMVLIVDDAQVLPRRVLNQVCKLLNWQDGGVQLLQVILAGQPSLLAHLDRVPALRDRVVVNLALTAMTPMDVQRMVAERLKRAGRQGDLFAPSAVQLIYRHARGMPRRVTILCLLSMWVAYQRGVKYITQEIVQAVVEHGDSDKVFAGNDADLAEVASALSALESPRSPEWLPPFLQRFWQRLAA